MAEELADHSGRDRRGRRARQRVREKESENCLTLNKTRTTTINLYEGLLFGTIAYFQENFKLRYSMRYVYNMICQILQSFIIKEIKNSTGNATRN